MGKSNRKKPPVFASIALVLLLCCVCSGVTSTINKAVNPGSVLPTRTPRPKPTSTQTLSLTPSLTPAPSATLEPSSALRVLVWRALGDSNRNKARVSAFLWDDPFKTIGLTVAANENLTDSLTRSGMQRDVCTVLKTVYNSHTSLPYQSLVVSVSFPMVDVYGNSKETVLVTATYSKNTLDKINWGSFLCDNVYVIADQIKLDPQAVP